TIAKRAPCGTCSMPSMVVISLMAVSGGLTLLVAPQAHPLHHLQPVAGEPGDLALAVGEEPQLVHPEIGEHLSTEAELAQDLTRAKARAQVRLGLHGHAVCGSWHVGGGARTAGFGNRLELFGE